MNVEEQRDMTYGEKAVGLGFNPNGNEAVHLIKRAYAGVIDNLSLLRDRTNDPEAKRLYSIAITEAQGAQMWAVKAITWIA
jgi:hypothetical protein